MDDAAVPPPARRRSLRIPGLAAAPWALVALVIAWLCGYTVTRSAECPTCHATLVRRESGFKFGWRRVVPLGKSDDVVPHADLAEFVDPECRHGDVDVEIDADARCRSRPCGLAENVRVRVLETDCATANPTLKHGTTALVRVLGCGLDDLGDSAGFGCGYSPGDAMARISWRPEFEFRERLVRETDFRATVRAAIDRGEVGRDDVRALLAQKMTAEGGPKTAESRRLREVVRRLAAAVPMSTAAQSAR